MSVQAGPGKLQRRIATFVRDKLQSASGQASPAMGPFEPGGSMATIHQTRKTIADVYLHGDGIEIGALHQPLAVPETARVRFVDRMAVPDLRRQYEELASLPLVDIDIIDNGEALTTLGNDTQDFVIANHFLEHCQNPIRTIQNHFRVLKPGGVLYLAVPDKRFTFDIDRPSTTIEHLLRDYNEGPEWSKRQHFEEWTRLVNKCADESAVGPAVEHLLAIDYSIHFHVWQASDLLGFVAILQRFVAFEPELFLRNGFETILILRKGEAKT